MSKVICDVCGTTYPETTAQCPICGSAKASVEQTAAGTARGSDYTYVKGGRFSQQNVKKRNAGRAAVATAPAPERRSAPAARQMPERPQRQAPNDRPAPQRRPERRQEKENDQSNALLIVIVVVLIIAIIAMAVVLAKRYLGNNGGTDGTQDTALNTDQGANGTVGSDPAPVPSTGGVACQSIQVSTPNLEFLKAGDVWNLVVMCAPEDTTDKITYAVADPAVATVDENGVITAVGSGSTVLTVTCGSATATVNVKCSFSGNATEPTDPPVEQFTFAFRTKYTDEATGYWDTTLSVGEEWKAYSKDSSIDPSLMTWSSDDTSVCTVSEDGIVTVVGTGKTLIHAEYGGQTFTCIIRVK